MSYSLRPHGLQPTRLLCLSHSLRVCSGSCPLSWWCYLSHPLLPPSPFAIYLSQHQHLFQWVSSLVLYWTNSIKSFKMEHIKKKNSLNNSPKREWTKLRKPKHGGWVSVSRFQQIELTKTWGVVAGHLIFSPSGVSLWVVRVFTLPSFHLSQWCPDSNPRDRLVLLDLLHELSG